MLAGEVVFLGTAAGGGVTGAQIGAEDSTFFTAVAGAEPTALAVFVGFGGGGDGEFAEVLTDKGVLCFHICSYGKRA